MYIMKKPLPLFILLFFFTTHAYSQTSVGFSDPDDIQPLLDYRLPEWGYDNFYLDFSINGLRTTQNDDVSSDFSGQLSPVYNRFRESEDRSSLLRVVSAFEYTGENQEEDIYREFEARVNLNAMERFYQDNSDLFFSGELSGNFYQNRIRDEVTIPPVDESSLFRNFSTTFSVGVGYGRLRNVNPMIRSLRLNERLNALDENESMGLPDLLNASEQFTRENAYRQNYDRPLKYFWNDMNEVISPELAALNPFDLLYLTDTSSETIGERLEGWEIIGSAGLQYYTTYMRGEDDITDQTSSSLSQTTNLVPSVSGAWFKNLSLEHQVGIRSYFNYQIPLNRSIDERFSIFNLAGTWLYTITDQILTNTSLSLFNFDRPDQPSSTTITAHADINYFLENSLALFSSLRFSRTSNSSLTISNGTVISDADRNQVQFNAGIRYYLKRGLF